jgi:polyvinyl alcohol dehydrogenase (cytochrome)
MGPPDRNLPTNQSGGIPHIMHRRFSMLLAFALVGTLLPGIATAHAPFTCAPSNHVGGDWPRFGNQLDGSRSQPKEKLIDAVGAATLGPAWTFDANFWSDETNNEITGYPVVANGCVFVGSSQGTDTPGWIFAMNADTGKLVWRTKMDGSKLGRLHYPVDDGRGNPCATGIRGGGVYSTLLVEDGVAYAFVSQIGAPYVVALDAATGEVLWTTVADCQIGSDAVSSPIIWDGAVWVGVSGTAAEGDEADRLGFQGNFVLIEAGRDGGEVLKKTYSIDPALWEEGYAGANIWSTMAVDDDPRSPAYGFGFVGTGNPFNYDFEEEHSNAIIKFDLRRTVDGLPNPEYGELAGVYKGDVEEFFPELDETPGCEELEEVDNAFAAGFECANLDLDFGATPNLWWDGNTRMVGAGQKSGVYHAMRAADMEPVWKTLVGHPSAVGGIVGSAAFDGRYIYGPHTTVGYLWALDTKDEGAIRWIAVTGDGVHWGNPVTVANRVVYTPDLKGFLNAYDAGTGLPLLQRPMGIGSDTYENPTFSWGGVSVARGTVYASIGVGLTSAGEMFPSMPNGYVIAFKPGAGDIL